MAKKRRKLNKDFEKKIYSSKKNVELVLAKIYDIDDEDIQKEYMNAFNEVVYTYDQLKNDYELIGFNDNSEKLINDYNESFSLFDLSSEDGLRFLVLFTLACVFSQYPVFLLHRVPCLQR